MAGGERNRFGKAGRGASTTPRHCQRYRLAATTPPEHACARARGRGGEGEVGGIGKLRLSRPGNQGRYVGCCSGRTVWLRWATQQPAGPASASRRVSGRWWRRLYGHKRAAKHEGGWKQARFVFWGVRNPWRNTVTVYFLSVPVLSTLQLRP